MFSFRSFFLFFLAAASLASAFIVPHQAQYLSFARISTLRPVTFTEVQVGDGDTVSSGDNISVHYIGKFENNDGKTTIFEDSRKAKVNRGVLGAKEGDPIIFPVGKGVVIEGWEKGILGNGKDIPPMKVGGKRTITIPANMAYGEEGRGVIPPNQDLTFDLELVKINAFAAETAKSLFAKATVGIFAFLLLNSAYLVITGQA